MRGRLRLVLAPLVAGLAVSGASADPGTGLRRQAAGLRGQEQAALLELYGLDSRLDAARVDLSRARARLAEIRQSQAEARHELRLARKTLGAAERRLGHALVALYESDQRDPFAIILGATSFSAALDGLDRITQVASSHAAVAAQARRARRQIARLAAGLRMRAAEASELEATAAARADDLARAYAERAAYLVRVRSESATLAERIAAVEASARAAEARAATLAVQASAGQTSSGFVASVQPPTPASPAPPPPSTPPPPPPAKPAPVQAAPSGARTLTVTATAYALHGTTSTGLPVGYGVVAVDPTVIPLGTRMSIPGYGEGVAADTGPGVVGAAIDVWVPSEAQAEAWGTQTLTITLH